MATQQLLTEDEQLQRERDIAISQATLKFDVGQRKLAQQQGKDKAAAVGSKTPDAFADAQGSASITPTGLESIAQPPPPPQVQAPAEAAGAAEEELDLGGVALPEIPEPVAQQNFKDQITLIDQTQQAEGTELQAELQALADAGQLTKRDYAKAISVWHTRLRQFNNMRAQAHSSLQTAKRMEDASIRKATQDRQEAIVKARAKQRRDAEQSLRLQAFALAAGKAKNKEELGQVYLKAVQQDPELAGTEHFASVFSRAEGILSAQEQAVTKAKALQKEGEEKIESWKVNDFAQTYVLPAAEAALRAVGQTQGMAPEQRAARQADILGRWTEAKAKINELMPHLPMGARDRVQTQWLAKVREVEKELNPVTIAKAQREGQVAEAYRGILRVVDTQVPLPVPTDEGYTAAIAATANAAREALVQRILNARIQDGSLSPEEASKLLRMFKGTWTPTVTNPEFPEPPAPEE